MCIPHYSDHEIQFYEMVNFEPYCQLRRLESVPLKVEFWLVAGIAYQKLVHIYIQYLQARIPACVPDQKHVALCLYAVQVYSVDVPL